MGRSPILRVLSRSTLLTRRFATSSTRRKPSVRHPQPAHRPRRTGSRAGPRRRHPPPDLGRRPRCPRLVLKSQQTLERWKALHEYQQALERWKAFPSGRGSGPSVPSHRQRSNSPSSPDCSSVAIGLALFFVRLRATRGYRGKCVALPKEVTTLAVLPAVPYRSVRRR